MTIEHELTIDAPAEVVWGLTIDVERWPDLTPTMTTVERLDEGPIRVGSQARVKQPAQRPTVWTVTQVATGERFAWQAKVFGVQMVARHSITALDAGRCRNLLEVELTGRGAGVLAKLTGGRIRRAIATENEGFKRAAETVHH
jgi:uncharacterized membrane protein